MFFNGKRDPLSMSNHPESSESGTELEESPSEDSDVKLRLFDPLKNNARAQELFDMLKPRRTRQFRSKVREALSVSTTTSGASTPRDEVSQEFVDAGCSFGIRGTDDLNEIFVDAEELRTGSRIENYDELRERNL